MTARCGCGGKARQHGLAQPRSESTVAATYMLRDRVPRAARLRGGRGGAPSRVFGTWKRGSVPGPRRAAVRCGRGEVDAHALGSDMSLHSRVVAKANGGLALLCVS